MYATSGRLINAVVIIHLEQCVCTRVLFCFSCLHFLFRFFFRVPGFPILQFHLACRFYPGRDRPRNLATGDTVTGPTGSCDERSRSGRPPRTDFLPPSHGYRRRNTCRGTGRSTFPELLPTPSYMCCFASSGKKKTPKTNSPQRTVTRGREGKNPPGNRPRFFFFYGSS